MRLQEAFLAGQHFAKHYPASMNRVNRLKNEFGKSKDEGDCLRTAGKDRGANDNKIEDKVENKIDKNCLDSTYVKSKDNDLMRQVAEEKSAAKLFSLNLISNKFKSNDLEALKGKKRTDFYSSIRNFSVLLFDINQRQPLTISYVNLDNYRFMILLFFMLCFVTYAVAYEYTSTYIRRTFRRKLQFFCFFFFQ